MFALLGVSASQHQTATAPRLPSIRSWFLDLSNPGRIERLDPANSDIDDEDDEDAFLFEESDDEEPSIQEVLDRLQHVVGSTRGEDEIMNYTYATVAISVDEHIAMYVFILTPCCDTYQ